MACCGYGIKFEKISGDVPDLVGVWRPTDRHHWKDYKEWLSQPVVTFEPAAKGRNGTFSSARSSGIYKVTGANYDQNDRDCFRVVCQHTTSSHRETQYFFLIENGSKLVVYPVKEWYVKDKDASIQFISFHFDKAHESIVKIEQELLDLKLPSSFTQPKDMAIAQKLEPPLTDCLKLLMEVHSDEDSKDGKYVVESKDRKHFVGADDGQQVEGLTAASVAISFKFMEKYLKTASDEFSSEPTGEWGYAKLVELSGGLVTKTDEGGGELDAFKGLYNAAKKVIKSQEANSLEDLDEGLKTIDEEAYDDAMEKKIASCSNREEGLVSLYKDAIVARMETRRILQEIEEKVSDVETVLADLKGFPRVTEKMVMRPKSGVPWDLVRAQAIFKKMSQIKQAAMIIAGFEGVKVVGLNNRFKQPTPNGWSDVAMYIQIGSVVAEVQLLHDKMRTARKNMGADEAYHEGRFAGEFLAYMKKEISVSAPDSVAAQIMLDKDKEKETEAPPTILPVLPGSVERIDNL